MNLNEFTNKELEILSDMLQEEIKTKREFIDITSIPRMKEHIQNKINTYELMRVKINNKLGRFK